MWQLWGRREIDARVLWGNLNVRHNLEDLSLDGKIILKKRQSDPLTGLAVAQKVGRGIALLLHDCGTRTG